jgi:phenylalanyl-tRNA synthetase beta chain
LQRNAGRGLRELALFEMGLVYRARADAKPAPVPAMGRRPSDAELAALFAAVPEQPRHVAVVLSGNVERPGWWGAGRAESWADAVEAARTVARAARVELDVHAADRAPWHPGRCAELVLAGQVVGWAGELHPRAVEALGLPERTSAMELDLSAFAAPEPVQAPALSTFPPVLLDVALTVAAQTPAHEVEAALREGAGELLESLRQFDQYADERMHAAGTKSLAYSLRLRAPDRTLTSDEAEKVKDAALALAAERTGAQLRH